MGNLSIRMASAEDAAALLSIYAYYVRETAITFEYEVPPEREFSRRIAAAFEAYPWLVAEDGGEPVGYAYAGRLKERPAYDWVAEASVYVQRDRRRAGAGRALYSALEGVLRRQGVRAAYACIAWSEREDPRLPRDSVYFHESVGYARAGRFRSCGCKFGTWYDVLWMEKRFGGHAGPPQPFVPLPRLEGPLP